MSQKTPRSRRHLILVLGISAAFVAAVTSQAQSPGDTWWSGFGNGPDNSRYFASRQIDKSNVNRLQVAWTYPFGDTGGNPIVVRGVIYGRGRNGSIVAVDARTGKELWVRENMNGMTMRGMMYWESPDARDRRLIFSMNDLLQELDAQTGKGITRFGTNGVVDLRVGIDGRDPATIANISSRTPGEIFENLIVLGGFTGEEYMSPPGDLRAYDVRTGTLVWTFHTVPRPGEFGYDTWPKDAWKYVGGTNTWGEITIDTARGIAYFPIGSPTYDYYGGDRIGANLFSDSLLALDVRTGKRLWHFQTVHHDLWDFDNTAAPQLTTIRYNGQPRDVVAMAGKIGFLYVFDRVTGEPIWPIEERSVPKSEIPGEQSWPTQPFPTKPKPFAKQSFDVDDVNPYLPAAEYEALKQRVLGATNKGLFTPIGFTNTLHIPGANGGTLFGGTAAEPRTGAVYVITQDNPGILRLLRPGETVPRAGAAPSPGQLLYEQNCQVCHGTNRQGTDNGAPLVFATPDPANNIAAGTPRVDGSTVRAVVQSGRNRMPAFAHLGGTDLDALVQYLTAAPGARGGGRGAGPVASGAPPALIVGSGSVGTRAAGRSSGPGSGRGGLPPYPDGVPQYERYVIDSYGTIGNGAKPPFTTIVKYDLNEPTIKWRIGFGDDPALAARGITGTGATQMRNSIIVTESGVLFGAGRDNVIRAWDSDTGRQLWSSRFGGNFTGSPSMYVMDGRQYLLVPAASTAGTGRGGGAASTPPGAPGGAAGDAPMGWVAYALPAK
jgi:quinoprotein glucose dehydrogenase